MVMNLFGYKKSVIKFALLKSSSRTKRWNLHWVHFVEPKHLEVKTTLNFHKIFDERFILEKPLTRAFSSGSPFDK